MPTVLSRILRRFGLERAEDSGFTELELVRLLTRVFEQDPAYDVIGEFPRFEDRLASDLMLAHGDTLVVVEVKRVVPQTASRFAELLEQLHAYRTAATRRASGKRVRMVLAIPGVLTAGKVEALHSGGFVLWDRNWIIERALAAGLHDEVAQLFGYVVQEPRRMSRADELEARLRTISCGRPQWFPYQQLCGDLLEYLFCPPLEAPIPESSNVPKVNRRDFVLPNYASGGFWSFLRSHYSADYIVIDAKNYCGTANKTHVLQLANYLSQHGTGLFGLIVTRNGMDAAATYTCREQWVLHSKMILMLNDADLLQMITTKGSGDDPAVLIRQKVEDFRLGM